MTQRDARLTMARVTRVVVVGVLLVLAPVSSTVAGATLEKGLELASRSHAAPVRRCDATKYIKSGSSSVRYPSCWTLGTHDVNSMFTFDLAYWSNQPMHDPCVTRRSATGTLTRCGYPITRLRPGGVLVTWRGTGFPGLTLALRPGRHVVVDHHAGAAS